MKASAAGGGNKQDLTPSPTDPEPHAGQPARQRGEHRDDAHLRARAGAGGHACDLAKRLAELEDKTEALAMNHDTFSRNTRNQLKQVFDALSELMTPPDPPKRPIGFIDPEDKSKKASSQTRRKT